jgi:hypothetical protein
MVLASDCRLAATVAKSEAELAEIAEVYAEVILEIAALRALVAARAFALMFASSIT